MIALALAVALSAPAEVGADSRAAAARFVVVIGYNGTPEDPRGALRFADDDAARLFLQAGKGARRAWLLTAMDTPTARAYPDLTDVMRAPTRVELARVLGELSWELRESKDERSEVMIYLAGHGRVAANGEGELALADGPLTREDLRVQVTEGIEADVVHLVIDACAAYHLVPRGGDESGTQRLTPAMLDAIQGGSSPGRRGRTGVVVATSDGREVHESAALGGGVFSYLFRSALAGGADIDSDGRVEYAEAAAFIEAASGQLGDPRARLQVFAAAPVARPHAELSDLRTSGAEHFLRFTGAQGRRVRVLDAHGVPMLEARRDPAEAVTLALVGQPFYIVQIDDEEAVLVPRAPGAYSLEALKFTEATSWRQRSTNTIAGLFAGPYSSEFVRGFTAAEDAVLPPRRGEPFVVEWAPAAAPPERFPWGASGGVTLGVAGVAAAAAVVAVVGNLAAFAELEQRFRETRTVDPEAAFAVESWRTAAGTATAAAVVFALAGAGMVAVGMMEDAR